MSDAISPARERKRINARADLIERAIKCVRAQINDLAPRDQAIVVVYVLQEINHRDNVPIRAVEA